MISDVTMKQWLWREIVAISNITEENTKAMLHFASALQAQCLFWHNCRPKKHFQVPLILGIFIDRDRVHKMKWKQCPETAWKYCSLSYTNQYSILLAPLLHTAAPSLSGWLCQPASARPTCLAGCDSGQHVAANMTTWVITFRHSR